MSTGDSDERQARKQALLAAKERLARRKAQRVKLEQIRQNRQQGLLSYQQNDYGAKLIEEANKTLTQWKNDKPKETAIDKNKNIVPGPRSDLSFVFQANSINYVERPREKYVKELRKYIPVDIFGACGSLKCEENCTSIIKEYKFYLAFENSICDDYVTEKFFRTLTLGIVPVVMGGANYTKMAPPKSYIHVNDFETPKHLADYLLFLDKKEDDYQSYFWWKVSDRFDQFNYLELNISGIL